MGRFFIVFVFLFSAAIYDRGYRGRTYFKQTNHKESPVYSPFKTGRYSYQKRTMSKHTYKMLRSRLTYLKSLTSSKETIFEPLSGEKYYKPPENIAYTFPGNSRLAELKLQRSQIYKKFKYSEPTRENIQDLEDSIERPFRKENKAIPVTSENSCEKAIETRKKFMKTNDRNEEILYLKYKTMCEEK